MSDHQAPAAGLSQEPIPLDADLLVRAKAGDDDAISRLYSRHRNVALGIATSIAGPNRAEDIVAEAFLQVFLRLRLGGGPDRGFRSYLLTAVRNVHRNQVRKTRWEMPVADPDDRALGTCLPTLVIERDLILRALRRLPERWCEVVLLSTVEGLTPAELGSRFAVSPAAAASLALRARRGLREAYLAEHVRVGLEGECRQVFELFPRYVLGNLSPIRTRAVEEHRRRCTRCHADLVELAEIARFDATWVCLDFATPA